MTTGVSPDELKTKTLTHAPKEASNYSKSDFALHVYLWHHFQRTSQVVVLHGILHVNFLSFPTDYEPATTVTLGVTTPSAPPQRFVGRHNNEWLFYTAVYFSIKSPKEFCLEPVQLWSDTFPSANNVYDKRETS